jgi:mRNA interferase HigB
MRIQNRDILITCYAKHPDAKSALEAWYADTRRANWKSSMDIKARYASASFLHENRVIFNISGNHYRLVAMLNYNLGIVEIRFADTHAEYDRINAEEI